MVRTYKSYPFVQLFVSGWCRAVNGCGSMPDVGIDFRQNDEDGSFCPSELYPLPTPFSISVSLLDHVQTRNCFRKEGKGIIGLVILQLLVLIISPNRRSLSPKHMPVLLTSSSKTGAFLLLLFSELSKAKAWFLPHSLVLSLLHTADCKLLLRLLLR